jgi:hypothetical protein
MVARWPGGLSTTEARDGIPSLSTEQCNGGALRVVNPGGRWAGLFYAPMLPFFAKSYPGVTPAFFAYHDKKEGLS